MVEQMKRIKVLFLAALLTVGLMGITPRVEAANWVWVTSTDYATIKIDADSCRWVDDAIYFWDDWCYKTSQKETKSHCVMYLGRDGTLYHKTLYSIEYSKNGHRIKERDYSSSDFTPLSPGCIGEEEYKIAKKYARY